VNILIKIKVSLCLAKHHNMTTYGRVEWRRVVSFRPRPLYLRGSVMVFPTQEAGWAPELVWTLYTKEMNKFMISPHKCLVGTWSSTSEPLIRHWKMLLGRKAAQQKHKPNGHV
jgi:hypothetical protein